MFAKRSIYNNSGMVILWPLIFTFTTTKTMDWSLTSDTNWFLSNFCFSFAKKKQTVWNVQLSNAPYSLCLPLNRNDREVISGMNLFPSVEALYFVSIDSLICSSDKRQRKINLFCCVSRWLKQYCASVGCSDAISLSVYVTIVWVKNTFVVVDLKKK